MEGVEMQNHDWITGVLKDLKNYSELHYLTGMVDVLTIAAAVAEGLVQNLPATLMKMRLDAARV